MESFKGCIFNKIKNSTAHMENSVRRVLVDEFKKTLNSTDEFKERS